MRGPIWLLVAPCLCFLAPPTRFELSVRHRASNLDQVEWNDELQEYRDSLRREWNANEIGVAVPSDPVASALDAGAAAGDALRAGERRMIVEARACLGFIRDDVESSVGQYVFTLATRALRAGDCTSV